MLELAVEVDGRPLSRWACDGLLLSHADRVHRVRVLGRWPGDLARGGRVAAGAAQRARAVRPAAGGRTDLDDHRRAGRPARPRTVSSGATGIARPSCEAGMEIEVTQGRHRLRLARLSPSPFTNRLVNKFRLPVEGWRGTAERDRPSAINLGRGPSPVEAGGASITERQETLARAGGPWESRARVTKHLFVTGGVASSLGKGAHRLQPRQPVHRPWPASDHAEARPVPQRGPGHHEPLPARRGVRHRGRRGDRPRHRALQRFLDVNLAPPPTSPPARSTRR